MEKEKIIADCINCIKEALDEKFIDKNDHRRWENFYIKKQIEKRKSGHKFTLSEHVQAMVYSQLSGMKNWSQIELHIKELDKIFCDYDIDKLTKKSPADLSNEIKGLKCGNMSIDSQMKALLDNIKLLKKIQEKNGSIDAFYNEQIDAAPSNEYPFKKLIKMLSDGDSNYKLKEMGIALVAEYLRNVGYDISKPDRHVVRLLGPNGLDIHQNKNEASDKARWEAFEIIHNYAKKTGQSEAYVDYLFWAYCADGYGEICTKEAPKCDVCKIKEYCNKNNKR